MGQLPMAWSKPESQNMARKLVALAVLQLPMLGLPPLLKAVAPTNIQPMFVTLVTFHAPMFWLKALLPSNMLRMLVTLLTSQVLMSWLKASHCRSMCAVVVTVGGKVVGNWTRLVALRKAAKRLVSPVQPQFNTRVILSALA